MLLLPLLILLAAAATTVNINSAAAVRAAGCCGAAALLLRSADDTFFQYLFFSHFWFSRCLQFVSSTVFLCSWWFWSYRFLYIFYFLWFSCCMQSVSSSFFCVVACCLFFISRCSTLFSSSYGACVYLAHVYKKVLLLLAAAAGIYAPSLHAACIQRVLYCVSFASSHAVFTLVLLLLFIVLAV